LDVAKSNDFVAKGNEIDQKVYGQGPICGQRPDMWLKA
jgi:hypothetical protein